jgi:hypothetical protein
MTGINLNFLAKQGASILEVVRECRAALHEMRGELQRANSVLSKKHQPATNVVTGELSRPIGFFEERTFECPNLDCMSVSELNKFAGVASTLTQYASLKAMAMLWREQGRIEDAKRTEAHLETLYQMLPAEWRW